MSKARAVGIVYETFDSYPRQPGDPPDFAVEYEPESTIDLLAEAIERLGLRAERLGPPAELLARIARGDLPPLRAALNIAEGRGSRNREAWAPVLLEMAGIPSLGSDALTLSSSLDKVWARELVRAAGLRVAPACVVTSGSDARTVNPPGDFPLFVKPRWEGTAKGIRASSRAEDREALVREVERITDHYAQPALVEVFVPGAEYTVAVVGNEPPRALPVLQRALEVETGIGLHALDDAPGESTRARGWQLPGELTRALESELQELALRAFGVLECRDFARADFRLDAEGRPVFLELNPLPTFARDESFGILAELAGRSAPDFVSEIIREGLLRLGVAADLEETT